MAAKPDKENTPKKSASQKATSIKKTPAKSKKVAEEDDLGLEAEETKPKAGKKTISAKSKSDDDLEANDDLDVVEDDDDSNSKKSEHDEDWDPDFDEFDLPKSSKKTPSKKGAKESDDDYKIDDEFKDLFGSRSSSRKYNEDDDY